MVKKTAYCALLVLILGFLLEADPARAEQWKEDFQRLCSSTNEAYSLSAEELERLVGECDSLLKALETLEVSGKKVYIFRLKKCRNLYQYMLDMKDKKGGGE